MHDIRLILVGPNAALCRAFQAAFAELPNIEVVHGSFEQLPAFDCADGQSVRPPNQPCVSKHWRDGIGRTKEKYHVRVHSGRPQI